MEFADIKIFIVSSVFLLLAEGIWNFFMLTGTLYILREKETLYTKKFYYYIVYGTIFSTITDRGFSYVVTNVSFLKNIWQGTNILIRLGVMVVPIIILITPLPLILFRALT